MQLDCSFFIPLQIIHVIFFLSASKQILGLPINWDIESLSSYLVIVLSPKSGGGTPQRETSGTGRLQGGAPPETEPKTFWLASGCTA